MKKEWIYFIAGAGLAAAIMSTQNSGYSDFDECVLELSSAKNPTLGLDRNYCGRYK